MFYPALQFLLWRHSGADVERMLELCVATTLVLSCVQSSSPKYYSHTTIIILLQLHLMSVGNNGEKEESKI